MLPFSSQWRNVLAIVQVLAIINCWSCWKKILAVAQFSSDAAGPRRIDKNATMTEPALNRHDFV